MMKKTMNTTGMIALVLLLCMLKGVSGDLSAATASAEDGAVCVGDACGGKTEWHAAAAGSDDDGLMESHGRASESLKISDNDGLGKSMEVGRAGAESAAPEVEEESGGGREADEMEVGEEEEESDGILSFVVYLVLLPFSVMWTLITLPLFLSGDLMMASCVGLLLMHAPINHLQESHHMFLLIFGIIGGYAIVMQPYTPYGSAVFMVAGVSVLSFCTNSRASQYQVIHTAMRLAAEFLEDFPMDVRDVVRRVLMLLGYFFTGSALWLSFHLPFSAVVGLLVSIIAQTCALCVMKGSRFSPDSRSSSFRMLADDSLVTGVVAYHYLDIDWLHVPTALMCYTLHLVTFRAIDACYFEAQLDARRQLLIGEYGATRYQSPLESIINSWFDSPVLPWIVIGQLIGVSSPSLAVFNALVILAVLFCVISDDSMFKSRILACVAVMLLGQVPKMVSAVLQLVILVAAVTMHSGRYDQLLRGVHKVLGDGGPFDTWFATTASAFVRIISDLAHSTLDTTLARQFWRTITEERPPMRAPFLRKLHYGATRMFLATENVSPVLVNKAFCYGVLFGLLATVSLKPLLYFLPNLFMTLLMVCIALVIAVYKGFLDSGDWRLRRAKDRLDSLLQDMPNCADLLVTDNADVRVPWMRRPATLGFGWGLFVFCFLESMLFRTVLGIFPCSFGRFPFRLDMWGCLIKTFLLAVAWVYQWALYTAAKPGYGLKMHFVREYHRGQPRQKHEFVVNRERLLEDSFEKFLDREHWIECGHGAFYDESVEDVLVRCPRLPEIRFSCAGDVEPGLDYGGVTTAWVHEFGEALIAAGAITCDNSQRVYHLAQEIESLPWYMNGRVRAIGRFLGVALWTDNNIDFCLSSAVYKYLCWKQDAIGLEDLVVYDPAMAQNLSSLLSMGAQDLEALELQFTQTERGADGQLKVVELKHGGESIAVSVENVGEYVHLVSRHRMCVVVDQYLFELRCGMLDVVPGGLFHMLSPEELQFMIEGERAIDVDDMKATAVFDASSRVIQWFWDAVERMSEEQREKLIRFVTGSAALPAGGFRALVPKFTVCVRTGSPDTYPVAHTCFNSIDLFDYSSPEELEARLLYCINHGIGFGLG